MYSNEYKQIFFGFENIYVTALEEKFNFWEWDKNIDTPHVSICWI